MIRSFFTFAALLAISLLVPGQLAAEDTSGGTNAFQVVADGGLIGWTIVLLSVVAMTLAVMNFMELKSEKMIPESLTASLTTMFEEENFEDAQQLCSVDDSLYGKIMLAGLNNAEMGYEQMTEAMAEATDEQATLLHQRVGWLSLIGAIAPMMGLFGTVVGMMDAFNKIANMGSEVTVSDLAAGIKTALATTCLGLFVAIPTLVCFSYFRNKIDQLVMEVTTAVNNLTRGFGGEEG